MLRFGNERLELFRQSYLDRERKGRFLHDSAKKNFLLLFAKIARHDCIVKKISTVLTLPPYLAREIEFDPHDVPFIACSLRITKVRQTSRRG